MTTVLLTGFEPFGGDASNPSGDAVRLVADAWDGDATLVTEVLPVTFAGAATRLRELLAALRPDVVIATGLAGGRAAIGVERVAINLLDARIPDNEGAQPVDEPSVAGAASAHFASVPVKAIARAMQSAEIPAEVSHTAGTFVCNHVFFTAMDAAPDGARAGFIHVPWDAEHAPVGAPSLPVADIARALRIAIEVAIAGEPDIGEAAGALH